MSNVKVGDLAILVRCEQAYACKFVGHVFEIVEPITLNDLSCWFTKPLLIDDDGRVVAPRDSHLRPIRPQDDDAADESKAWLPPVPQLERV